MTYDIGTILLAPNYQLPTAIKDKFFIVIGFDEDGYHLLSMTTSKIYFDPSLIKHGKIVDRDMCVYCFKKGKIIGENGFCFYKDTIVSLRKNVYPFTEQKISALNMVIQDVLIKEEIIQLLYCFLHHKDTVDKHKKIFDKILEELLK